MSVIRVRVPASAANMGPGFDSMGLALGLYNEVSFEMIERGLEVFVPEGDRARIPANENNYIYQVFAGALEKWGVPVPPVRMIQKNGIPICSGLGSSSACILMGLLAANAYAGNRHSREEILREAARLEGHPDNVLPALLGGCVAGCMDGEDVKYVRFTPPESLAYIILHPQVELSTSKSRSVLPASIPHKDAVFNVGRTALLVAALMQGNLDALAVATQDKLHQPYRKKLIANWDVIEKTAMEHGAINMILSGAGPTMLVFARKEKAADIEAALWIAADGLRPTLDIQRVEADLDGAVVSVE